MLQQFIDEVDVGVSHLTASDLGLGDSWVGQPTSFPSLSLPRRPLQLNQCSPWQGVGPVLSFSVPQIWIIHIHMTRASYIVLSRQGAGPSLSIAVGGHIVGRDKVSFHMLRAVSPVSVTTGAGLVCYPGKEWDHLSQVWGPSLP